MTGIAWSVQYAVAQNNFISALSDVKKYLKVERNSIFEWAVVATLPVFVCTFVCNPKGVISPLISPANPLQSAEVSSQGQLLGTARYLVPGSRTICHSCYKI